MPKKIAIIGAGSAVFSLNVIRDLCLTPNLRGLSVSLMDIDPGRLQGVHGLCRRYAEELGMPLELEATQSREAALRDADFVINTALVGGWKWIEPGWEIGLRHGYRFGGSLHFMHDEAFWMNFNQLRFFDALAQDILRLCPRAQLLLVANPVFAGTTYLGRAYPELKVIGLCHGFSGVYNLVEALGLERDQVTFETPGVNHFVWLTRFLYRGADAYPLIDGWLATNDNTRPDTPWQLKPKRVDLYRRLGLFPIGDTGSEGGGDWPWWHHVDDATEDRFHEHPRRWFRDYIDHGYATVAELNARAADLDTPLTRHYPPRHSGEVIVPVIEALACDIPRVLIGNVPNHGGALVPGVPADIAVEVPTLVSGRGIHGIETTRLPADVLAYLLRDYVAAVDLELAAYNQRSRRLLLELVMQDPWTRSRDQAERVLDEILALPFNTALRDHYR